jgi:hypothetical protein
MPHTQLGAEGCGGGGISGTVGILCFSTKYLLMPGGCVCCNENFCAVLQKFSAWRCIFYCIIPNFTNCEFTTSHPNKAYRLSSPGPTCFENGSLGQLARILGQRSLRSRPMRVAYWLGDCVFVPWSVPTRQTLRKLNTSSPEGRRSPMHES